jgi:NADH:ubiquinone oxidoreductase subunit 6 (subunit J)
LEIVIGGILIGLAIIFAILTIEFKDLIYMVFSFAIMSISIGAFYFLLNAVYVGVFQMLVYAGAVVAMAIAAIMLTKGGR